MCGITGIWNFDKKPVDRARFERFTDSLSHRGPDGRGTWFHENAGIALGHRRLAILDLSDGGHQPMSYDGGRYWITYNGEIYNFLELRADLEKKGHVFRSQSDTEVILAAYREWGTDMLLRFNGMWAFAIYDQEEQTIFISRDRFGIKPFLYTLTASRFAFASEMKAFSYLDGFEPSVDRESASIFLRNGFGIEGTDRTMLKGLRRLPGGHYGIIKGGRLSIVRWWNTLDHLIEPPSSLEAQAEHFRELFYDSIRIRMRSDVPIGTCLSGGFDSTAIVCALAEIGRQRKDPRQAQDWQQAFVATFPGASNDERVQAEEAIRFAGIQARFMPVTESDALLNIHKILMDFDDVYIGLPTPVWLIYRELRKAKVVVSLDGHGADELMGGYEQMDYMTFHDAPSLLFSPIRNMRLMKEHMTSLSSDGKGLLDTLTTTGMSALLYHPDLAFLRRIMRSICPDQEGAFLRRNVRFPHDDFIAPPSNDKLPSHWGEINRMLYPMFHSSILPTILRNFDRLSMAHGVEVRMPFMDWRLVTFVFSLPDSSKLGDGFTKRVARLGMAGKMPDSIRLSKTKIGFNSPLPEWLNGPLQPWVNGFLTKSKEHELIDLPRFQRFLKENMDKRSWAWPNTVTAWRLLHFLWFEKAFVKRR